MYATWLVGGIIVVEGITGVATDAFWNSMNRGRTFDTVDWSKFKSEDDENQEEEEEEEEEEGGEDDDEDEDDEDDDDD